jgi:hypothetical protein
MGLLGMCVGYWAVSSDMRQTAYHGLEGHDTV